MAGLVWNDAALHRLFVDPSGGVMRDMEVKGQRVLSDAQRRAPVRTGKLRSSLSVSVGADAAGPYVDVVESAPYARLVEKGTKNMRAQPYLEPALSALKNI